MAATMGVHRQLMREEEPEWFVWALVLVMLAIGLVARVATSGQTKPFSESGVALSYPAEWSELAWEGRLLYAADPLSSGSFPTSVSVQQLPMADVGQNLEALSDVALAWSTRQGKELLGYRALRVEPTTLNGQEAVRIEYGYVASPQMGTASSTLPVVARAQDILIRQGETLTVITLAADADSFDGASATWEAILASVNVNGGQ